MTQSELLVFVIGRLTQTQTPYMITGSVVSSLQGEPRSTHDIDIVIVLQVQHVASFAQHFPKDQFYINEDAAKDAIRYRSMFNVIDMHSGNKLDFWLLSTEEYDCVRFARRQKVQIAGFEDFYVTTPEDTILSKLKWAKMAGGSEKQLTDATRVYETQYEKLDIGYIENWVLVLHLQKEWQMLKDQAELYI
jgi:hypothetical protein